MVHLKFYEGDFYGIYYMSERMMMPYTTSILCAME
jgi:hypothetical protein